MSQLEIRDLAPAFGAEVQGYDPTVELDAEERRVLKEHVRPSWAARVP